MNMNELDSEARESESKDNYDDIDTFKSMGFR